MTEPTPKAAAVAVSPSYMQWGAVIAGAVIAGGISLVLMSFGSAIGLAVTPVTPSWRPSSLMLALLSGVWVLVTAVGSLAAGGYIAGRMRATWTASEADEVEFRDGVHGLVVWALAVSLGALLSALAAAVVLAGAIGGAAARPSAASAAPVAYEVDRLFRSDAGPVIPPADVRDEASRLLSASVAEPRFNSADRGQLVGLVMATTALTQDAAQARVSQSIAAVQDKASKARHAAIVLAFATAASLLAGAAAAWGAACIGGRHRDTAAYPSLAWRGHRIRVQLA